MGEDDGLLMNWSVGSASATPTKAMPQVKGGWKAKRQAVKTFRRSERIKLRQTMPTPPSSQTAVESSLKPKPERVEKTTPSEHVRSKEPTKLPQVAHKAEGQGSKPKGDQVVSSLFDRNTVMLPTKLLESSESAQPTNAPTGEGTFPALNVPPVLHAALEAQNIKTPSIIQRKAIPAIYEGRRDVMMIAQTGSGKTLAFCLPIMAHLANNREINRKSGIFAVILAPTRELASQTFDVLSHLTRGCQRIVPVLLIGGEKRKSEKERLRRGANIIVGTPGRVSDHLRNTQSVSLIDVRWVVLDEGDRLVELGFEETLSEILETIEKAANPARSRFTRSLPTTVTKVVVSATMSGSITRLGTLALTDPVWVSADSTDSAGSQEGEYPDWTEPDYAANTEGTDDQLAEMETPVITERAPGQLVQQVIICPMKLRLVTLAARLEMFSKKSGNERALVFFSSADSINFHFSAFTSEDSAGAELKDDEELEDEDEDDDSDTETEDHVAFPGNRLAGCPMVFKLHGGLTQAQRTKSLREFAKAEGKAILLCTDVASRGLDVPISCVIEYDPPPSVADHLHRVGRTARAGAAGLALLFLLPSEQAYAPDCIAPVHESKLVEHSAEQLLSAAHGRDWQNAATRWQLLIERWVLGSSKAKAIARAGFVAHMRAYATHAHAERKYFVFGAVHTGHLAKCFGLRETPRLLGSQDSKAHPKKTKSGRRLLMIAARRHANIGDFNVA